MLIDFKNFKIDPEVSKQFFEDQADKAKETQRKVDKLHESLKDLNSLEKYIRGISVLEKKIDPQQDLSEYWDLVETAEAYGERLTLNYSLEVLEKINPFASEIYHYKDYLFCTMYGQGTCPWFSPWKKYKDLLEPEL